MHLIYKVSVSEKTYVLKKINKSGSRKAILNSDISVKILKQNSDIFGSYICLFLNLNVGELLRGSFCGGGEGGRLKLFPV